jgi:uncharacterized protein YggE
MRALVFASLAALVPAAVFAQAAPASPPAAARAYDAAPWWMREPVIASVGHVRTELPANRANFGASFQAVARTAPEATRAARDQVRALGEALKAYGAEAVRVETTFTMRPLYDQYRDAQGRVLENARADQVERYEVNAVVNVEVRDLSRLERVYATVLAARPTNTHQVAFRLEPDNAARTELYGLAVADAARRARLAVEGAGARLGAVKVIDPTSRACQTDVLLAGAERADPVGDTLAQDVMLKGARVAMAPPAPPPLEIPVPPGAGQQLNPEDMMLPLQPPLRELTASACVVYALG